MKNITTYLCVNNGQITEKQIYIRKRDWSTQTDIFGNEKDSDVEEKTPKLHFTKTAHAQNIEEPINNEAKGWIE